MRKYENISDKTLLFGFVKKTITCVEYKKAVFYTTKRKAVLISNLDMSYKNLSARANCSISLLCAFRRFFSSDVGTYFKSCKQPNKQKNTCYKHFQRETINILHYLKRKLHQPQLVFMQVLYSGKPGNP